MSAKMNPDQSLFGSGADQLDARGHRCPVPTLKLRRRLETLAPDAVVDLLADDPMAQIDIPHFCNQNRCLLLSVDKADNHWVFRIRRTG
jgi:tRNA 2-thiouridine synthesizing protein A